MGIGGWLSTARSFVWFSEIFSDEDVRQQWPQLSGSLQPYISCFETLAQLALAQCSWQRYARAVHGLSCQAPATTLAQSLASTSFSALPSLLAPFCAWLRHGRICTACSSRSNTWQVKRTPGPMPCPADASHLYSIVLRSGFALASLNWRLLRTASLCRAIAPIGPPVWSEPLRPCYATRKKTLGPDVFCLCRLLFDSCQVQRVLRNAALHPDAVGGSFSVGHRVAVSG